MSGLVGRLRGFYMAPEIMREAADRIERLEKVLEAAKNLEWGAADPNLEKAAKAKLENAIAAAEADNE